jgi:hypothetical protein
MATKYTKKHYIDIAKVLSKATEYHYQNNKDKTKISKDTLEVLIYDFDDMFMIDNDNYNSELFLKACNIEKLRGY